MGMSAVGAIAVAQRAANARRTTVALGLLTLLATVATALMGASLAVNALLMFAAAGQGVAYVLVRRGSATAGVFCSAACLYMEHVGVVAIVRQLGPVPYIVAIVILLVAATEEARWLPLAFVSSLVALGVEAWLSPWAAADRQAIVTAALFAAVVFVVSLLHARGTERAFDVAERQDQARASAAAAAMDSERRYRLIADSTDDLIALVDRDGNAMYLSPSNERILGLSVKATLGRPVAEFLNLENGAAADSAFRRTLDHGESRIELQVRRPDGTLRLLDAEMKRVDAEPDTLVAIISRDVTERRDLEMRLQASERLEALGRLAGSVAHDFNNLLTVIGGATELARGQLPGNHPSLADLDAVLEATRTLTELTRQLLTFSRKQLLVRARVDLAPVLEAQRDLLARMVGGSVRIEYRFEAELPAIWIPRAHVEQLAMNLAGNARDAMPAGGLLLFTMRRRTLADREVGDLVAGSYVELDVTDEGAGIPSDILPHLFEPFFSTKGLRGTGLGLATCFGIVTQAGGTVQVDSQVGRGTTFKVFLPAADAASIVTAESPVPGEVGHVLVVDDDARVRELTIRMLRSEGHEVHAASTVAEARGVLDDGAIRVDAMLTDVVLGAEKGTDLLEPCRRIRPHARIIVTSGYTPDPDAAARLAAFRAEFLPKPFGRDQLVKALRGRS
jgi:two-component system, cell cycle sensor histidine kinase and response regulator CckA